MVYIWWWGGKAILRVYYGAGVELFSLCRRGLSQQTSQHGRLLSPPMFIQTRTTTGHPRLHNVRIPRLGLRSSTSNKLRLMLFDISSLFNIMWAFHNSPVVLLAHCADNKRYPELLFLQPTSPPSSSLVFPPELGHLLTPTWKLQNILRSTHTHQLLRR